MSNSVNISVDAKMSGVTSVSENNVVNPESLDIIVVNLPASTSQKEVLIGGIGYTVQLLVIKSNLYPDYISFQVHSTGAASVQLQNMQIYQGIGQLSLLATPENLDKLYFTNINVGTDVVLTIYVGRDVTPEPAP